MGNFNNLKNVKKHPWRSATLLKVTLFHGVFQIFKLWKWHQVAHSVSRRAIFQERSCKRCSQVTKSSLERAGKNACSSKPSLKVIC